MYRNASESAALPQTARGLDSRWQEAVSTADLWLANAGGSESTCARQFRGEGRGHATLYPDVRTVHVGRLARASSSEPQHSRSAFAFGGAHGTTRCSQCSAPSEVEATPGALPTAPLASFPFVFAQ